MKFTVHHAKIPNFGTGKDIPFTPEHFEKVAEVECENIDQAYWKTQHTDDNWSLNEEVTCFKQARSTSVGDVIVNEAGERFRCKNVGWEKF